MYHSVHAAQPRGTSTRERRTTLDKAGGTMSKSDESRPYPKEGATRRDLLLGGSALAAASAALSVSKPALSQTSPASGSEILPVPDKPFRGVIGRKATESKPDFPKAVMAPEGAPNVLLIMTDDVGFG